MKEVYFHGDRQHRMAQGILLAHYSKGQGYTIEPFDALAEVGILPDLLISAPNTEKDSKGRRRTRGQHYYAIEIETNPTTARKEGKFAAYKPMTNIDLYIVKTENVLASFGFNAKPDKDWIRGYLP